MIRSSTPGGVDPTFGQRAPLTRKSGTSVSYGHRAEAGPSQGQIRGDSMVDTPHFKETGEIRAWSGDGGADHAQDEFERRHDRRQGVVQTHASEGGARIPSPVESMQRERGMDSLNFPADKDW